MLCVASRRRHSEADVLKLQVYRPVASSEHFKQTYRQADACKPECLRLFSRRPHKLNNSGDFGNKPNIQNKSSQLRMCSIAINGRQLGFASRLPCCTVSCRIPSNLNQRPVGTCLCHPWSSSRQGFSSGKSMREQTPPRCVLHTDVPSTAHATPTKRD